MHAQIQQIRERCAQAISKAMSLYGVDLRSADISFDLKGRAAGMAYLKAGRIGMRFNRDMLTREAFGHVLNNTVPHEVAHLVCFKRPDLGRNHDSGWEKICIALGGSGATRHQEDVVMGKGTTYEYVTDRGHKVRVGERHHRRIQAGDDMLFRHGKGTATKSCAYSIVGYRGRTLAQPIVKAPTSTKEVPVAALLPVHTVTAVPVAAPVAPVAKRVQPVQIQGESKAMISRRIMLSGFGSGKSYAEILDDMIATNSLDRQLAISVFTYNAPKLGIPASFYA